MALRSDIAELLSGFKKRMKFINIVRCLIDYKYPDAIRAMIPDKKILDNIIIAVLVYIKDRTLGTEQTCTLSDIEYFLEEFAAVLPNPEHIVPKVLSRYIVVDVLQNGGIPMEFTTFNSRTETFEAMPIRLINEEKGCYHLTDDAFDFLFRSKEIESELDYSVTRFRLKEYMKRNNYADALDASRELVSRIRNMKISMDDFLLRCREDLSKITIDQYEYVVSRVRNLLEDEYKELAEIQDAAKERVKVLDNAQRSGLGSEDTYKHYLALQEIIENITLTINEQRSLINKKTSMSESYQALIRDNFVAKRFEQMNFNKDIMAPLRRPGAPLADAAKFLLFMLTKPELEKQFSIENFYAPQSKIKDQDEDGGLDIDAEDTDWAEITEKRNQRHLKISQHLFQYMSHHNRFPISDFVNSLRMAELVSYCEENTLPNVLLSIFALQEVDISSWKNDTHFTITPNGEFELSWCLEELPLELLNIQKIKFTKTAGQFSFSAEISGKQVHIDMTDFEVEVIR